MQASGIRLAKECLTRGDSAQTARPSVNSRAPAIEGLPCRNGWEQDGPADECWRRHGIEVSRLLCGKATFLPPWAASTCASQIDGFMALHECINMNNLCMNSTGNFNEMTVVRDIAKAQHIAQREIADAVGTSQSQVSRVLSGQSSRHSRLSHEICKYVYEVAQGVSIENVRRNEELMSALATTWDGSPKHAAALAAVIRSLRILAPNLPRSGKN